MAEQNVPSILPLCVPKNKEMTQYHGYVTVGVRCQIYTNYMNLFISVNSLHVRFISIIMLDRSKSQSLISSSLQNYNEFYLVHLFNIQTKECQLMRTC